MIDCRPKYITFDLYGTLTAFGMSALTRELFADRIPPEQMEVFVGDFAGYRIDEVLGAYKPYPQVIKDSLRRTAARWGVEYRDSDGQAMVDADALPERLEDGEADPEHRLRGAVPRVRLARLRGARLL